jgi:hypothetical protein
MGMQNARFWPHESQGLTHCIFNNMVPDLTLSIPYFRFFKMMSNQYPVLFEKDLSCLPTLPDLNLCNFSAELFEGQGVLESPHTIQKLKIDIQSKIERINSDKVPVQLLCSFEHIF